MQKINKFNRFVERIDDDSWSSIENDWNNDDSTDYYDKDYYGHDIDNDSPDYDDDKEDGMENIKYLLRKMFKNKGLEKYVINSRGFDIEITIIVNEKERLSDIVNMFDLLNKLKKDILPQYESEFDMWTNRKGDQVFEVIFLYDDDGITEDDDDYDDESPNKYTIEEDEIFGKNGGKIPF